MSFRKQTVLLTKEVYSDGPVPAHTGGVVGTSWGCTGHVVSRGWGCVELTELADWSCWSVRKQTSSWMEVDAMRSWADREQWKSWWAERMEWQSCHVEGVGKKQIPQPGCPSKTAHTGISVFVELQYAPTWKKKHQPQLGFEEIKSSRKINSKNLLYWSFAHMQGTFSQLGNNVFKLLGKRTWVWVFQVVYSYHGPLCGRHN